MPALPAGAGSGLRGYTRDRESGAFTLFHLKQFLRLLASIPEVEQLHLMSFRRIGQLQPEDLTDEQRRHLERIAHTQLIDAWVPTGLIGHAYFYRHPAVSADLVLVLRDQLEPGSPGRPLRKCGPNFWQITPDYPRVPGPSGG